MVGVPVDVAGGQTTAGAVRTLHAASTIAASAVCTRVVAAAGPSAAAAATALASKCDKIGLAAADKSAANSFKDAHHPPCVF